MYPLKTPGLKAISKSFNLISICDKAINLKAMSVDLKVMGNLKVVTDLKVKVIDLKAVGCLVFSKIGESFELFTAIGTWILFGVIFWVCFGFFWFSWTRLVPSTM